MLQAPVMAPEGYAHSNFWSGGTAVTPPNVRALAGGGFLVDWELRSSLEGLYVAGGAPLFGGGCHGEAQTTGRYAGRKAAEYAKRAPEAVIDRYQLEAEIDRAYAPLKQERDGIGWKEINYAIARIMQDYCGKYKNELTLKLGLRLLRELKQTELSSAYASNPHEQGRLLEGYSLIAVGELVMNASLVRKASSVYLDFYRLDYPELDPPEWHKLLPVRLENNEVRVRELPVDYHLRDPYAPTYEENYLLHCQP
jgi:succinate dehydrogenase/fumarate reductase flavoprotein subunit